VGEGRKQLSWWFLDVCEGLSELGWGRGVEERFFIRTLAKRVPGLEVRWTGGQAPAGASLSGCYWPSLRWAQGWLVFPHRSQVGHYCGVRNQLQGKQLACR
jgi:hypothetical protein